MKKGFFARVLAVMLCAAFMFTVSAALFSVTARADYTPTFDVNARSAYLVNLETGEIASRAQDIVWRP